MLNVPRPRAVIFDLDGVLIDSERVALAAIARILAEAGIVRSVDDLRPLCGHGRSHLLDYLDACTGSDGRGEHLARACREAIEEHVNVGDMQPFPGAERAVAAAKDAGLLVAVASSSGRRRVDGEMKGTDIAARLDALVTGEEVVRSKPDPQIFLTAARRLGVEPEACVVVEDSLAGITAARRAGMRVIALAQTFAAHDLGEADLVLPDIAALPTALFEPAVR
jgi:HAD superfamily hydrolase (TIGR01509 family)